jgi:hypothetical protein
MNRLSDLLIQKLSQYDGQPVVINDWCHFITFDIMGELGFGQSYGQLESGRLHNALDQITKFLRIGVCAIQVPWLVNIVQSIPGLEDPQTLLRKFSARCMDEREKVSAIDEQLQFPTRSQVLTNKTFVHTERARDTRCYELYHSRQRRALSVADRP